MANENNPNDASRKSKAEGERWKSDSDTVERYDRQRSESPDADTGGISNRPLEEETESQASVTERGSSREDAGPGDQTDDEIQRSSR
jgi:hypothetical protein